MAEQIDELVVKVNLDATGFDKGRAQVNDGFAKTKDAALKSSKEISASGQEMAGFFRAAKVEALALVGVLLGTSSLGKIVEQSTKALVGIGQAAGHIGSSVPQLDAFANMIGRNGGEAKAATGQLLALHDAMLAFKLNPQGPISKPLFQIGAERNDSAITVAEKYSNYAQKHPELAYYVGHQLGFDNGTIEALKRASSLPGGISGELGLSRKLGVATGEMTDAARKLTYDFVSLSQAVDNVAKKLTTDLQPALSGFFKYLTEIFIGSDSKPDAERRIRESHEWLKTWEELHGAHPMIPPRGGSSGAALTPPQSGTEKRAVMNQAIAFYRAKGLSDVKISGILAGMSAESGFNPYDVTMEADGKPSYGLFQYHKTRLDGMIAKYGPRPTAEQQMQYAWDELHTSEKVAFAHLNAAKTSPEAGAAWTWFERPHDLMGEMQRRGAAAPGFMPQAASNVTVGDVHIHTTASTMKGAGNEAGHALAQRIINDSQRGLKP